MANTKYQINVFLQDNVLTVDDPNDKFFVVHSQGTADQDRIIDEVMDVQPGLERETIKMALEVTNRVIMKLLLQGMRINNGLYVMELSCKGITTDGTWNPEVNKLQINFTPTKELREILDSTTVKVVGEKPVATYLAGGESAQGSGFIVKAGRSLTLRGKNIKVSGTDPSVGITLTSKTDDTIVKIEEDMMVQNDPSKVVFIVPSTTADGEYELKLVTQYSTGSKMLKEPRTIIRDLTVGEQGDEPTVDDDEPDGPAIS